MHDFLLLEAARTEATGKSIDYTTVENAALTFSDGKGKDLGGSNLALGADDKEKKEKKPYRQGNQSGWQHWQGG